MAVASAPLALTTILHHSQTPKSLTLSFTTRASISSVSVSNSNGSIKARFGSSRGGAGVLERPSFDQSQFDPATQVQEGSISFCSVNYVFGEISVYELQY